MVYTSIFGQDLTDYDIRVLTESGVQQEQWAKAARELETFNRNRGGSAFTNNIIRKVAASAGLVGTAYRVFSNVVGNLKSNASPQLAEKPAGEMRASKRLRSESNPFAGEWLVNADGTDARDRGDAPLPNLQDEGLPALPPIGNDEMDTDMGEGETTLAARSGGASSGGMGGPVSKETPISPYPSLSYGLQETHTTILPYRAYFSVASPDYDTPVQLKFRMNSIWDMFVEPLSATAATGTVNVKGKYNVPLNTGTQWITGQRFPSTIATGAVSNERPQWRDYWAEVYEYYTVLGCKWKLTMINVQGSAGGAAEVAIQYDTYSDTAGSTGNIMPVTSYMETKAFKNIQWHIITERSAGNNEPTHVKIVDGTYKPGQAKRNISNDGDVKTWTGTGTTLPTLKEFLTLNFFAGGVDGGLAFSSTANGAAINCCIELDYIVQFKDLKLQARYPNSLAASVDLSQIIENGATDDVRIVS